MPELGEVLTVDYWREHTLGLAYAVAALVLFLVFMIGTFPYDQALTGALMPLGLEVTYTSERPGFPLGAVFEDFRLLSADHPSAPPLVESESLKLYPALGMLIGRATVGLRAEMYGGRVWANVRRNGEAMALQLALTDVDLSRYPPPPALGTPIKGIVSGTADFQNLGSAMNEQKGNVSFEARQVEFSPIRGFPLQFTRLAGSFNLDGQSLRVNALEGGGPDMAISASGVIHLGPTPAQTMIDITLRITPTMAGRTHLGALFAFLPHPPDNRPYILHGPLLMPQAS
jgi:type II secretion system protein N